MFEEIYKQAIAYFSSPSFAQTLVTLGLKTIGAILVLFLAYFLVKILVTTVKSGLDRLMPDDTLHRYIINMVGVFVWVATAITVLGMFGIFTTSVVTVLGCFGLAIGLALQNSLQNISAGIMLLMFRPFTVGDEVEVGEEIRGVIYEIGVLATVVDVDPVNTPDDFEWKPKERVYIPNSAIFSKAIKNRSVRERQPDVTSAVEKPLIRN
jgi:small conductance mechanosensitive channel